VLLLDEPTAACDAVSCSAVEQAIINCGAACVVITHDDRQAVRLAHRRIILTATVTNSSITATPKEGKPVSNSGEMADV
jgi:ABC-type iron transport system FetAB ATPase subunit